MKKTILVTVFTIFSMNAMAQTASVNQSPSFFPHQIVNKKTKDTIRVSCWNKDFVNCSHVELQFWISKKGDLSSYEKINTGPESIADLKAFIKTTGVDNSWDSYPLGNAVYPSNPWYRIFNPLGWLTLVITYPLETVTDELIILVQNAIESIKSNRLQKDIESVLKTGTLRVNNKTFEILLEAIRSNYAAPADPNDWNECPAGTKPSFKLSSGADVICSPSLTTGTYKGLYDVDQGIYYDGQILNGNPTPNGKYTDRDGNQVSAPQGGVQHR